jgi:hemerythrin
MSVVWGAWLETGVAWLDSDHKEVIDLANSLMVAIETRRNRKVLRVAIDRFRNYFQRHLAKEEDLMRELGYGEYASHKADHDKIVQELAILDEIDGTGDDTLEVVSMILIKWISTHLDDHESNFARFIERKALSSLARGLYGELDDSPPKPPDAPRPLMPAAPAGRAPGDHDHAGRAQAIS